MMNAIRVKMKEPMRSEKQRLKGISPLITDKNYSEAGLAAESVL